MSAWTLTIVRPGYGSRWTATVEPCAAWAARMTSGSRRSSGEPQPHHDETTSWIPAPAISRIWAWTTRASELE